jgi:hypothetical protein
MLSCIYDNPDIPDELPEDMFFSQCVAKSSKRPPNAKTLNQFCTQFVFREKSWGAHKTNIDLQNNQKLKKKTWKVVGFVYKRSTLEPVLKDHPFCQI